MAERHLTIRLTSQEKAVVDRALRTRGASLQAWAKSVLLAAAEDDATDPAARSRIQRLTLAHAHVARALLSHLMEERGERELIEALWEEARNYVNDLAPRRPLMVFDEEGES